MTADSTSPDDVSITVELTETSIKVAARSRFVSAIDRLGGNVMEWLGSPIDGWNERRKARIAGEKQIIEAATKFGVDKLEKDDEFAARVFTAQFGKMAREQVNKDAVLEYALEDLKSEKQGVKHVNRSTKLDEGFLDRFEIYAAQATTDALRERWGRVLASEVREPGTFSNKVLRVVDEMEPATARLFEQICQHRIGHYVPKCLVGTLSFSEVAALATAGLALQSSVGHVTTFDDNDLGQEWWLWKVGGYALAVSRDASIPQYAFGEDNTLFMQEGLPATEVHVLTDEGEAVATILPDNQSEALEAFAVKTRAELADGTIQLLREHDGRLEVTVSMPAVG